MRFRFFVLAIAAFAAVSLQQAEATPGTIRLVSVASDGTLANSSGGGAEMSSDGRTVAFVSPANNLVPGDSSPISQDVFVHDNNTRDTVRVSVWTDGSEAICDFSGIYSCSALPSLSSDGRFVAFQSNATNWPAGDARYGDVFVHDRDADNDSIFDEPEAIARPLSAKQQPASPRWATAPTRRSAETGAS